MAAPSQPSPNQASETAATAVETPKETAAANKEDETSETPSTTTTTAPKLNEEEEEAPTKNPPPSKNPPILQHQIVDEEEVTYQNTQNSNAVCIATQLLKDGDFDASLEVIGEEMSRLTSLIGEEAASIHECMAPLYYLYGTTLLYSIEESTDVAGAAAMNATSGESEEEEEELDDLQIAWENLETARHLVSRMVNDTTTLASIPDIQLDLAQIHLRLGDLLKANGRNVDAISEYLNSLKIRQAIFGDYHPKVSSCLFGLAQAYMLLASEADTEDSSTELTPKQVQEYRIQAIQHYVQCAKSFAGQIVNLCNDGVTSVEDVVTVDTTTLDDNQGSAAGTKTTGMDPAELEMASASNILKVIRQRVEPLSASNTTDSSQVHEWKELLDEIQETIDEVETSKQGIQQVSHMKVLAKEAVDNNGEASGAVENADGSTTTIGFASSAATAATTAFAGTSTTTTETTAKPMMVIKKKKKRTVNNDENEDKKPAAQQGDAKRAKTE